MDGRPPTQAGLIKAPRKLELAPRALWIAKDLERVSPIGKLGVLPDLDIVSEFPEWMNIQLGWAAGDLQKLVFLVGTLAGYFYQAHSFTLVKPSEWKGQLPKQVVIRRLIKRFGIRATRDWDKDMWDAVGIGMWKLGQF